MQEVHEECSKRIGTDGVRAVELVEKKDGCHSLGGEGKEVSLLEEHRLQTDDNSADNQLGRVTTAAYDTYQSTADSEMVFPCKVSTERGRHHLQCGGGQIVLRKEAVET